MIDMQLSDISHGYLHGVAFEHALFLLVLVFCMSMWGVLSAVSTVKRALCIQLALMAIAFMFALAGYRWQTVDGQTMSILVVFYALFQLFMGMILLMRTAHTTRQQSVVTHEPQAITRDHKEVV